MMMQQGKALRTSINAHIVCGCRKLWEDGSCKTSGGFEVGKHMAKLNEDVVRQAKHEYD